MSDDTEPPLPGNWPPSRGPQPDDLKEPLITVPVPRVLSSDELPPPPEVAWERDTIDKAIAGDDEEPPDSAPRASVKNEEKPPEPRFVSARLYVHVESIAKLDARTAERVVSGASPDGETLAFLPTRTYRAIIDYPIKKRVAIGIAPLAHADPESDYRWVSIGYLLWAIARVYRDEIYANWEKYGVWGHGIGDLWFEGIEIDGEQVSLTIGS